MSKADVLNPVSTVFIRGESIEVRELTWKDYLRAVKDMADNILRLVNNKGVVTLDKDKVIETISAQEVLVSRVIQQSTGKDQAWIEGLSGREFLQLLKAIVELNLSDEVVGVGKTLAGRMSEVFGLKSASLVQSTTSSVPATDSKTSKA